MNKYFQVPKFDYCTEQRQCIVQRSNDLLCRATSMPGKRSTELFAFEHSLKQVGVPAHNERRGLQSV